MKRVVLGGALFAAAALSATSASADRYGLSRTCPQVWENGPFIQATCYTAALTLASSRIDARRCGGSGVVNLNGRLACGYEAGGYGGGYYGGPQYYGGGNMLYDRPYRHRPRGPNWD